MISAPDIAHAAASMVRAHGERAIQETRHMVEKMTRRGDPQGLETWSAIHQAVRVLLAT